MDTQQDNVGENSSNMLWFEESAGKSVLCYNRVNTNRAKTAINN